MTRMSCPVACCEYTGDSLLGESTGGYVLAAVIAFMAGVIITAATIRKRSHNKDRPEDVKEEKQET